MAPSMTAGVPGSVRVATRGGCGSPHPCSRADVQAARRYASTASTRRWSSTVGGRSSLEKIEVTCFSTARSVTTSASAIALLERPSAIRPSTSRSRAVRLSSGSSRLRRPSSSATTSGSSAEPPLATRRTASVYVGGIRTSTTATSGLCAPTLRIRSSASPAWPTTSNPDSSSRRQRPSRSSTESSATTTRNWVMNADDMGFACQTLREPGFLGAARPARRLAPRLRQRYSRQELLNPVARELRLRHESAGAGAGHERPEVRPVATRDEDHDRRVVGARQARGDVEAVDVGQLHVEQHHLGAESARLRDRLGAVGGLAHDVESLGFEEHARGSAKRRVVVDDEDPRTHVATV